MTYNEKENLPAQSGRMDRPFIGNSEAKQSTRIVVWPLKGYGDADERIMRVDAKS